MKSVKKNPTQNIVVESNKARPVNPFHADPTPPSDPTNRGGQIRFFLDDESNTAMIQNIDVPTAIPDPPFTVQNYVGYIADQNSPQALAANCMATLLSAQAMVRKYLGPTLPRWSHAQVVQVFPQAGSQLNAFYNRSSFQFFTGTNPVTGQPVHTCLSNDTITHEFFHAILDSLKPAMFNSPLIEQSAAHEGIADCGSILHALTMDPTLTLAAQQLDAAQVSTIASSVGPDLGYAINGVVGGLRDASVVFYYQNPENLPRLARRDQLTREFHSFSRVLSSAFYAALMAVYKKVKGSSSIGTREALIVARDVMGNALFQGIIAAPLTTRYMSSLANSILTAAAIAPYVDDVGAVFLTWGLSTVQSASAEISEVRASDRPVKFDGQDAFIREKHATMILADKMIVGMQDNPLYYCKVEFPCEELLMAQSNGMAAMVDGSTEDEILEQVKLGLDYIWESDLVTLNGQPAKDQHLFGVDVTGSLTRRGYNYDDGYFNNATLPGAPEYGKFWKPENNSGCCSGCKKTEEPTPRPPKLGCYVSERVCGSRTVRSCQVVRQKVC